MKENQTEFKKQAPNADLVVTDRRHLASDLDLPAVEVGNDIVMAAIQRNLDPALIEKVMDLAERNEKNIAKKGHFKAVAEFKKNIPTVIKDGLNAVKNPYPTVGNLLGTVNPVLAQYGLSVNFNISDSDDYKFMTVSGVLSHELGHSEETSITFEIETTGAKGGQVMTKTHARMTALTYAMRATFSAVVGIAAIDPKHDNDGIIAEKEPECITKAQQKDFTKRIKKIYGDDPSMFFDWLRTATGAETVDTIPAKSYQAAKNGLDGAEKQMAQDAKPEREPGQEG